MRDRKAYGELDVMVDDAEYDDDHHQSYSNEDAASAVVPEWESSEGGAGGEEREELLSLTGEKKGKIAWLMRYVHV